MSIKGVLIVMSMMLIIPVISLYMWIRHPIKCINEGKRMWRNRK